MHRFSYRRIYLSLNKNDLTEKVNYFAVRIVNLFYIVAVVLWKIAKAAPDWHEFDRHTKSHLHETIQCCFHFICSISNC